MRVFFGGQTITLGKYILEIGRVSIEVETGLSVQLIKDWFIKILETENPTITTIIQKSLEYLLEETM